MIPWSQKETERKKILPDFVRENLLHSKTYEAHIIRAHSYMGIESWGEIVISKVWIFAFVSPLNSCKCKQIYLFIIWFGSIVQKMPSFGNISFLISQGTISIQNIQQQHMKFLKTRSIFGQFTKEVPLRLHWSWNSRSQSPC